MHQGTSNCGTASAVHFARVLGYCMMVLPPIHAPQSPHAFCRLGPSPVQGLHGETKRCSRPATGKAISGCKGDLKESETTKSSSTRKSQLVIHSSNKHYKLERMQALQLPKGLKRLLSRIKRLTKCCFNETQAGMQL